MRSWQNLQHQFWRSISRQGFAWFLLAVGCTFASMGFLLDLTNLDAPFSNALYGAVFSALLAISWFVSMTHYLRLLPIVIALPLRRHVVSQRCPRAVRPSRRSPDCRSNSVSSSTWPARSSASCSATSAS